MATNAFDGFHHNEFNNWAKTNNSYLVIEGNQCRYIVQNKMKWNESCFRPPLCTYRLNWARRTSWGWWDDWDDTVLQTQDSKFEPWRSEAEHATSRSRRLPTILTFTRGWGRNNFVSFKPRDREPSPGVKGSGANHYHRAPAQTYSAKPKAISAYFTSKQLLPFGFAEHCRSHCAVP